MRFPEVTVYGLRIQSWYERVIGIFFDEAHLEVTVTPSGDKANVKVVVKWEVSVWKPPGKSERIIWMLIKPGSWSDR